MTLTLHYALQLSANSASIAHGICGSSFSFDSKHVGVQTMAQWFTGTKAFKHNATMNTDHHDATLIALLDRIAQQDHAALKSLYDLCASKLYGLALRVVTNRDWEIGRAHV